MINNHQKLSIRADAWCDDRITPQWIISQSDSSLRTIKYYFIPIFTPIVTHKCGHFPLVPKIEIKLIHTMLNRFNKRDPHVVGKVFLGVNICNVCTLSKPLTHNIAFGVNGEEPINR